MRPAVYFGVRLASACYAAGARGHTVRDRQSVGISRCIRVGGARLRIDDGMPSVFSSSERQRRAAIDRGRHQAAAVSRLKSSRSCVSRFAVIDAHSSRFADLIQAGIHWSGHRSTVGGRMVGSAWSRSKLLRPAKRTRTTFSENISDPIARGVSTQQHCAGAIHFHRIALFRQEPTSTRAAPGKSCRRASCCWNTNRVGRCGRDRTHLCRVLTSRVGAVSLRPDMPGDWTVVRCTEEPDSRALSSIADACDATK